VSKIVVQGGDLEVVVTGDEVHMVATRERDADGPSMMFRLVLDADSAKQLGRDLIAAACNAAPTSPPAPTQRSAS
jgi:hypothetical protein